jgi:hypothetical protein
MPQDRAEEEGEDLSIGLRTHYRGEDSGESRSEAEAGQACDPTRYCILGVLLDTCQIGKERSCTFDLFIETNVYYHK